LLVDCQILQRNGDKVMIVRFRFVPQDGERQLSDADLKTMPRDFLERTPINRLRQGPAHWVITLTIGEPGDPEDDPTILWPANRKELKVGTLTIASATSEKQAGSFVEKRLSVVLRQPHRAGEKCFVDFCDGTAPRRIQTGLLRPCRPPRTS
jgi:hypothetical protein